MTRISEELLVRHCSPTLAGLKTGNIFTCHVGSRQELKSDLRELNRRLGNKGLRFIPLRYESGRAMVYVFRPQGLAEVLADDTAASLLWQSGYAPEIMEHRTGESVTATSRNTNACLSRLRRRLEESDDFPHELGLFLGYPPEDVRGFIENKAAGAKCAGCWKVYGDVCEAQKLFCRFRKCTRLYLEQLKRGRPVEKLAVKSA